MACVEHSKFKIIARGRRIINVVPLTGKRCVFEATVVATIRANNPIDSKAVIHIKCSALINQTYNWQYTSHYDDAASTKGK